MANSHDEKEQI